jgi:hypothetical protein
MIKRSKWSARKRKVRVIDSTVSVIGEIIAACWALSVVRSFVMI